MIAATKPRTLAIAGLSLALLAGSSASRAQNGPEGLAPIFLDGFESGDYFGWSGAEFGASDRTPPQLQVVLPAGPIVFNDTTPAIQLDYSDADAGIAPGSFGIELDGADILDTCSVSNDSALCESPSLSEGAHVLRARVWDLAGTRGVVELSFDFVIDTQIPTLTIESPPPGVLYEDFTPGIELSYGDLIAGIDVATLVVEVDSDDIAATCDVTVASAVCYSALLDPGIHTLLGRIRDLAGNEAQASVSFELREDSGPPTVTITNPADGVLVSDPVLTISGTATDDGDVFSVEVSGVLATRTGDAFSAEVTLEEGFNRVVAVATDVNGKQASAAVAVTLDSEAPTLQISSPRDGQLSNAGTIGVAGEVADLGGSVAVVVNGAPVPVTEGQFETAAALVEGMNTILAEASDEAGNLTSVSLEVRRLTVPEVTITSPTEGSLVTAAMIEVSGTISDPTASVSVNGVVAAIAGSSFLATGVPVSGGRTLLSAVATLPTGAEASAKTTVFRDTEPPRVTIYEPQEGAVVFESSVEVSGLVNDTVLGTVNGAQVTVEVNGVPAAVSNRSFFLPAVALQGGENLLGVVAEDASGNMASASVTVFQEAPTVPWIQVESGNHQASIIGTGLPAPLQAKLLDGAGSPVAGETVVFSIVQGNGTLAGGGRSQIAITDGAGIAGATFALGTRAGVGNHRVEATSAGFQGKAIFSATGLVDAPALLHIDSGAQQSGATDQFLPDPFAIVVTDIGFNRLGGVPVLFEVLQGLGRFANGETSITLTSDGDGRAAAGYRLGSEEGISNEVVTARVPVNPGIPPVTFVASALAAGDPADTRVSGIVLDNANRPVPGASVGIAGTGLSTQTDASGLFSLTGVPVGTFLLEVDGTTTTLPGTWPHLEFELTTIAGRDNTLGRPIYLLPLDMARGLQVSETEGGVLRVPELPGFSLEIAPGSVTFPDGSPSGLISATLVHGDKVPMVPNFGQQPNFIVTLQPAGATFDPPARITLPNTDGLAPGEVTELYSFDHDLGQFVSIGPGSVSPDGTIVASDPGVGVLKAGWHCGGNPVRSGTPHDCPQCKVCNGSSCVPGCPFPRSDIDAATAAARGLCFCSCDDRNPCTGNDCCSNGFCLGTPIEVEILEPPDNPNPQDADFATNFTFLSTDTIMSRAVLTPDDGDPQRLMWHVRPAIGTIKNPTPANMRGLDFSFQPDITHPPYRPGRRCASPGNGDCNRSEALSFDIEARFCANGEVVRITQDQIDIVRQEYVNHGRPVPTREEFSVPTATTSFSVAEITRNSSYTIVRGDPGGLAQNVRDEYNRLINDDVQVIPVGMGGLPPTDVVVNPGATIALVGALLDTAPCNNAPNPPDCDDMVMGRTIIAGPNGISETEAVNRTTNFGLRLSSGWRNPERNEAVGGIPNSRHQRGGAVDLQISGSVPGKTGAELYCILLTAGNRVGSNALSERGPTPEPCDSNDVTHVHVNQ